MLSSNHDRSREIRQDTLIVGVDIGSRSHTASFTTISGKKYDSLSFENNRVGFDEVMITTQSAMKSIKGRVVEVSAVIVFGERGVVCSECYRGRMDEIEEMRELAAEDFLKQMQKLKAEDYSTFAQLKVPVFPTPITGEDF